MNPWVVKYFLSFSSSSCLLLRPFCRGATGRRRGRDDLHPLAVLDYRESPRQGFSNLSMLGPLFKFQRDGEDRDLAVRPFFYRTDDDTDDSGSYGVSLSAGLLRVLLHGKYLQVLQLFQKKRLFRDEVEQRGTMLFPFYISGNPKSMGPISLFFPFMETSTSGSGGTNIITSFSPCMAGR